MTDSEIREGDRVCIEVDKVQFKNLQEAAGIWSDDMSKLLCKVGVVKGFSRGKNLSVDFDSEYWQIVPTALKKIPTLRKWDVVRIIDDEEKVNRLQSILGSPFNHYLKAALGKHGLFLNTNMLEEVVVDVATNLFWLHPACCDKVDGDVDLDDGDLNEVYFLGKKLDIGFPLKNASRNKQQQSDQQLPETDQLLNAILNGDTDAVRHMIHRDRGLIDAVFALHLAANENKLGIVQLLLEEGAKKDKKDEDGDTALNVAICREHVQIAEHLIYVGADVTIPNAKNETPLHNAACTGQSELVKLLLTKNCDVNAKDMDGDTALHIAIKENEVPVVDALLTSPEVDLRVLEGSGFATIHAAVLMENETIVQRLIAKDHEIVNFGLEDDLTALHYAAYKDFPKFIEILIKAGAEVNKNDKGDSTPLHSACAKACYDSAQVLVQNNANVNLRDIDGNTPLHYAMMVPPEQLATGEVSKSVKGKRVRLATYLIQHGANPEIGNNKNKTPYDECPSKKIKKELAAFKKVK